VKNKEEAALNIMAAHLEDDLMRFCDGLEDFPDDCVRGHCRASIASLLNSLILRRRILVSGGPKSAIKFDVDYV
jgi:hypothetical protein